MAVLVIPIIFIGFCVLRLHSAIKLKEMLGFHDS